MARRFWNRLIWIKKNGITTILSNTKRAKGTADVAAEVLANGSASRTLPFLIDIWSYEDRTIPRRDNT